MEKIDKCVCKLVRESLDNDGYVIEKHSLEQSNENLNYDSFINDDVLDTSKQCSLRIKC